MALPPVLAGAVVPAAVVEVPVAVSVVLLRCTVAAVATVPRHIHLVAEGEFLSHFCPALIAY